MQALSLDLLTPAESRYLLLYAGTLVIHILFMNYVLAGTALVAFANALSENSPFKIRSEKSVAILRDWLPFILSAAITAGVAPLLFVQILYQHSFYSAQLLLSGQWLMVMMALIAGFYLLYLQKSKRVSTSTRPVRALVSITASLCLVFTAFSWTRNHLLSLHPEQWADVYASQSYPFLTQEITARLGVWCFGAIPVMCTGLLWQLRTSHKTDPAIITREARMLSGLSLGGIVISMVCGVIYATVGSDIVRQSIQSAFARPFVAAVTAGLFMQSLAWIVLRRAGAVHARWLWLATLGVVITVLATTIIRETIRLSAVDLDSLRSPHATAARAGGLGAFLVVLAGNTLAIVACIVMTKRAVQKKKREKKA